MENLCSRGSETRSASARARAAVGQRGPAAWVAGQERGLSPQDALAGDRGHPRRVS